MLFRSLTNSLISFVLSQIHPVYGWVSAIYFIVVGVLIPYFSSISVKEAGVLYRQVFADNTKEIKLFVKIAIAIGAIVCA